jgi:hypothetical protein
MERVDLGDPLLEQDRALVAPVDLGLRPRDDLEPAVQPGQPVVVISGEALASLGNVELDPLVVAGEPVFGDQPFVDRTRLQARIPRARRRSAV